MSPGASPTAVGGAGRERFSAREFDEVLSCYALGRIDSVREVALGTPASPKAVVECARGRMLLKRRARGVDAPGVVAFGQSVMLGCLRAGVCVPPLVGTRDHNNSMVQIDDRVYELFVYIEGRPDPRTAAAAERAGRLLGELHAAMDGVMRAGVGWAAPAEGAPIDPGRADRAGLDREIAGPVRGLLGRVAAFGAGGEAALVHGDWHPGNVIFRGDEPVAVCDFDNTRMGSREREVAQGLAQFSLVRAAPGEPPARWAGEADLERLAAHWRGYVASAPSALDPRRVVGLMPGVLMEEAIGSGHAEVVWAVLRKAQWLEDRRDELVGVLGAGGHP